MAPRSGSLRAHAFVDSGAFIALFSATDNHHGAADAIFRAANAARRPLVTSNLAVAEVQRFLLHRVGIRAARAAIDHIEASAVTIVFADRAHHDGARAWLSDLAHQKITYTDAVSFAIMQAARCTNAVSFDHDFQLAGFTLVRP